MIVAGGAIIAVVGFLGVVGGLAAGSAVSLFAWPFIGIAVLVAWVALELGAGLRLPAAMRLGGIDSIATLLVALFGLVMGGLFLWVLGAALWGLFGPQG